MTSALRCTDLAVSFGDVRVLDGVDLEVGSGETVALLGPSGSGKTTLLYAIAGLVMPERGEIAIAGRVLHAGVGPEDRSISMVFQNYALWPHLDALHTVAYPLERRGVPRPEALARAAELLERVGIRDLGDRLPDRLSGGEQQRVGLARALAAEPALFLFDEPTAHLDSAVREALQRELIRQRSRSGAAAVYTTHDAAEAMAVADRVAVLRNGRIVQVGSPVEVYERPAGPWVAALTGPVSSLLCELVDVGDGTLEVRLGAAVIAIVGESACDRGNARLMLRPGWATVGGPLTGVVRAARYAGPHTDYAVAMAGGEATVRASGPPALGPGDATGVSIDRGWVVGLDADASAAEPHPGRRSRGDAGE